MLMSSYTSSTSDFSQTSISPSLPEDQHCHKCFYKLIHIFEISSQETDGPPDGKRQQNQIKKQSYLTCEAVGALAGVSWRRGWLTCCDACCSIQTAVWLYQAGIAYILTKLSNPSWGTNTLQENNTLFVWVCQSRDLFSIVFSSST